MIGARVVLVLAVAALTAAVLPAGSDAANECNGIPRCIHVPGPWVAVPAKGEVEYLLECPKRQGIVAGLDALATSTDVRAVFDGILGSPVAFGRTTTRYAFFRAVSVGHRRGAFQPFVGCIPTPATPRPTTSAHVTPVGAPLDLAATTIRLIPGTVRTTTLGCASDMRLVDSWDATTFATTSPPPVALAGAIRVQRTVHAGRVSVSIVTSEALPRTAHAEVQLGVRCAVR